MIGGTKILVALLCLLCTIQIIFSSHISVQKRNVPIQGTHLRLDTEFQVYLDNNNLLSSKKLVLNVVELFSSSVFIDEFELSNFVRGPVSSQGKFFSNFTIFNSRVSVEEPETQKESVPILSVFAQEFTIPDNHKPEEPIIVKMSIPFHLRYQAPSEKKLYRNVPILKFPFYSFITNPSSQSGAQELQLKPNIIDLESFLFSIQKKNQKMSDKHKFISRKRIPEEDFNPKMKQTKEVVEEFFSRIQQEIKGKAAQNIFLGKADMDNLTESSNWFIHVKMSLGDLNSIVTVIVVTLLVTVCGSLLISFF